jgi:hypothetical protein
VSSFASLQGVKAVIPSSDLQILTFHFKRFTLPTKHFQGFAGTTFLGLDSWQQSADSQVFESPEISSQPLPTAPAPYPGTPLAKSR